MARSSSPRFIASRISLRNDSISDGVSGIPFEEGAVAGLRESVKNSCSGFFDDGGDGGRFVRVLMSALRRI